MEIIVGSYNHVVFGFQFQQSEDGWCFQPRFTDQGHAGLVKAVGVGGRYLASGSSDETMRLFDLKKHIELGVLVQQTGTITCIEFSGTSHMFSGSEDGTICIWKTKSWECEKTLKGHRGAVTSFSLHPTGRLALSVSKDKTVRTWNLLTGRAVYTTSIKEVGEIVRWAPSGRAYAIVTGKKVQYQTVDGIDDEADYQSTKNILCIQFVKDAIIIIGGEDEDIVIYDFKKKIVVQRFTANKIRTKALSLVDYPGDPEKYILFTVASDGILKAWAINKENLEEEVSLISKITIPGRPTCMAVYDNEVKPPQDDDVVKETSQDEARANTSTKKKKKNSGSISKGNENNVAEKKKKKKKKEQPEED